MKKLMLVSAFNPVSRLLPRVEPELKAKTVAFIPTASKGSLYSPIMGLAKHALRRMDVSIYSLDIASASYGLIHDVIEASDIIYVGGGNSFLLLQEMRRSGADTIITEAVTNGKPYIGESAGAVVAGPDIGYIRDMDDAKAAPLLHDSRGPRPQGRQNRPSIRRCVRPAHHHQPSGRRGAWQQGHHRQQVIRRDNLHEMTDGRWGCLGLD